MLFCCPLLHPFLHQTSDSEQIMLTCASSGQVLDGIVPVVLCMALGLPLVNISSDLFISPDADFYSSNKGEPQKLAYG